MPNSTSRRKDEHLDICFDEDVTYHSISTGFERLDLSQVLSQFSDITPHEVDLSTHLLNKKISAPIIISGMTGGTDRGETINKSIAKICEKLQLGMGVGSQRAALEHPEMAKTFQIRETAPSIPLFSNLGIAQILNKKGRDNAIQVINMIEADALAVHVNALQEFVQKEGDKVFNNALSVLGQLIKAVDFPIMVKGVGFGINSNDAKEIIKLKPDLFDVGGAGGTNWTKIEALRMKKGHYYSSDLIELGISTVDSIINVVNNINGNKPLIVASGGVWSGTKAVKALLLGADYVALALPILKTYKKEGEEGIRSFISTYIYEMKIIMAMLGLKNIEELKDKRKKILSTMVSSNNFH